MATLTIVSETQAISNGSAEAEGYKQKMMNFQIILNLFLLEKILSITYCLSQQLQGVDLDIVNASSLIRSTKSAIEALRSQDSFDGIFNSAEKFADDFNISSSNSIGSATLSYAKSPRIRQVSVKLKEFFVTSTIGNRHSDHHEPATEDENAIHVSFRYNVSIPFLDRLLAEYDRRFLFVLLIHFMRSFLITN